LNCILFTSEQMLQFVFKWLSIFLLVLLTFSCAPTKKAAYIRTDKEIENINKIDKIYHIDSVYTDVIQTGDELLVTVLSGNDDANAFNQPSSIQAADPELLSYIVDEEGYLKLPYVDRVRLEGLSINEATDVLETELSQYIYMPSVSIRFVVSRVSVLGEVNTPGIFVFNRKSINIFQALAYAGDITNYGNRKKVLIIRQEDEKNIARKHIDLTSDKILTSDWYIVQADDIIYVEPLGRKKWGMETFPWGIVFTVLGTTTALYTFLNSAN
jgi:polysaccharide biosynthesis/export protein